ncbi:MAG: RNA 2',3'-cyclic phosphodiesterase [Candidatus Thermoplasmatota archaeon]
MTTFRGFIAIDIRPNTLISEFQEKIKKSGVDIKLVNLTILHITLKFLGEVEETQIEPITTIIHKASNQTPPFTITLQGAGVFPHENYIKVIWVGIENSKPIKTLADIINQELEPLGFPKESKNFSPHLTIGRVRTVNNKQQLRALLNEYSTTLFGTQEITAIKLKKSNLTPQGPQYTTLQEIQLLRR